MTDIAVFEMTTDRMGHLTTRQEGREMAQAFMEFIAGTQSDAAIINWSNIYTVKPAGVNEFMDRLQEEAKDKGVTFVASDSLTGGWMQNILRARGARIPTAATTEEAKTMQPQKAGTAFGRRKEESNEELAMEAGVAFGRIMRHLHNGSEDLKDAVTDLANTLHHWEQALEEMDE